MIEVLNVKKKYSMGISCNCEEILGRINSSSVAFVASIFFALHMACQPYDNRRAIFGGWDGKVDSWDCRDKYVNITCIFYYDI